MNNNQKVLSLHREMETFWRKNTSHIHPKKSVFVCKDCIFIVRDKG